MISTQSAGRALAATVLAAILAACSGGASGSPGLGVSSLTPTNAAPGASDLGRSWISPALAPAPHNNGGTSPLGRADHHKSWMLPEAKGSKALLYVGSWSTQDVYVYDYKSGKEVGTLTGFDGPYGMCVDKTGDVYITSFYGGSVVEYAHGGTKVLNTYTGVGEPIGCAVDTKNDVAVTSFSPGGVTVFAGGDPSKGATYSDSACAFMWTMGYDAKSNLYGVGEHTSIVVCELPAGSTQMRTVRLSGVTIDFPGGVTWDGKYLVLTDQESGGTFVEGLERVREIASGNLQFVSSTTLTDDCYSDYVDDVNPFIVAKVNTPGYHKQAYAVAGPNLWCYDAGKSKVDYWKYPAGGLPDKSLSSPPVEPYGAAVSIAE